MNKKFAIEIQNLSKSFSAGSGTLIDALKSITCRIDAGDFVIIVGANGSGKSTFLKHISGKEKPDSGHIKYIDGPEEFDWLSISERKRAQIIKVIEQDPTSGSVGSLNLNENLTLASLTGKKPSLFRTKIRKSDSLIGDTIFNDRMNLRTDELSYGQRQLFNLELIYNLSFDFLLLDEPTASLDKKNANLYMKHLHKISENTNFSIVLITHNFEIASEYGNRLFVFDEGEIVHEISGERKSKLRPRDIVELCGY